MTDSDASPTTPWWRDPLVGCVVIVWIGLCVMRIDTPPLRGEETRWARIAEEMSRTGDYVVPRQQGVVFPDRPPLFAWTIALSAACCGEFDSVAVRIPSALAALATALVIFMYARGGMSSFGAAASAVVFLTFGQVMQFGRAAECEAVNAALLTAALLGWHHAYRRGLPPWQVWTIGYAFAALSALTKGMQGPVYFGAATGAYLLLRRDWRFLLARGHVVGVAVFAALFGGWWLAFYRQAGPQYAGHIVFGLIESRVLTTGSRFQHSLKMIGMTLGALLPWSPFLLRYVDRGFRTSLGPARDLVLFCGIAAAVTFPTICFVLGSMSRHWMGLFGCVAVLCGTVVERSFAAAPNTSLGFGWRHAIRSLGIAAAIGAGFVVACRFLPYDWARLLTTSTWFAAMYLPAGVVVAAIAIWSVRSTSTTWLPTNLSQPAVRFSGFMAVVGFIVVSYVGVHVAGMNRLANDVAGATAALKERLPAGTKPVSFGPLDHPFLFYYHELLAVQPWPEKEQDAPAVGEYFLYSPEYTTPRETFAWETVDVVSCSRTPTNPPTRTVVLGRRLPTSVARTNEPTMNR